MTRYPIIKVRLYPTTVQSEQIIKTFGCCRYLWNQMLSDVQEFYAATDIHYIPTPAKYKKSAPFLAEVDSQALCTVHQNLRKAFLAFFRSPQQFGYPKFKQKGTEKDTFTVFCRPYRTGPSIYLTEDGIQMPKLGVVKAVIHRKPQPEWTLSYITITRSKSGKYYASIVFRTEVEEPKPVPAVPEKTLGLNHSLRHFYVDSEGGRVDLPPASAKALPDAARLEELRGAAAKNQAFARAYCEPAERFCTQRKPLAGQSLGRRLCPGGRSNPAFTADKGRKCDGIRFWKVPAVPEIQACAAGQAAGRD